MSFARYLRKVRDLRLAGRATEHSYRPALEELIGWLGGGEVTAINEPSRVECGAPDFVVERRGVPVGHVECKDVGANLDRAQNSDQLRRYRSALPNLVLTDYVEFRWFVDGSLRLVGSLDRFDGSGFLRTSDGDDTVRSLLTDFLHARGPRVDTAGELAERMAAKARLLRDGIERILGGTEGDSSALTGLLDAYRKVLIGDLTVSAFADMQAQTAAYGLFAARCVNGRGPGAEFTRQSAVFAETTPFLKTVFGHVAGSDIDTRIAWIVDDLALLLANTDMGSVLASFGSSHQGDDPVIHFYEDFLAAYDPALRERRGVYYTPQPVVSYIVRSVDSVLRERFDLADGLADTAEVVGGDGQTSPRVLVLDPAAGTGTFLREVVLHIRGDLARRGLAGAWEDYVPRHLLPRLFGFELLMAAYTICHLKLALAISDGLRPFQAAAGERLNVFLTNTLLDGRQADEQAPVLFAHEIAREASEADAVKRDRPVMVIIGNPPYKGHSANKGKWISDLLRGRVAEDPHSYFEVDGQPLGEPNPKWLNDDYVKFIRFAQWRINRTGEGVLAFVTNHNYLNNPTFRGMRQSLLETFDDIWILDLHGNAQRKERTPDGSPDQNVFDIQLGVAISIFVKTGDSRSPATVRHADLWGDRGDDTTGKYGWLSDNSIDSTRWTRITPQRPDYFFVPSDYSLLAEYEDGWKITDISQVGSTGLFTARDKLTIQWTPEKMSQVAADFAALDETEARHKYKLPKDRRDWQVALAQNDIRAHNSPKHIQPIQYRPFDTRYTYYTGTTRGFLCMPRPDVMPHLIDRHNLGLSVGRAGGVVGSAHWDVALAVDAPTDLNLFRRGGNRLLPLYLYGVPADDSSLDFGEPARTPNLAPEWLAIITERTGLRFEADGPGDLLTVFGPEDAFHYIYAVLHSPRYRRRYADFLRSDYPRIPTPQNKAHFTALVPHGKRLADLHLMNVQDADLPRTDLPRFDTQGTYRVDTVRYTDPTQDTPGQVWINTDQSFDGVSQHVWQFTIGGYQPAHKWLKDRKGRKLDFDDIQHYRRLCAALAETRRIMRQIDETLNAQQLASAAQAK